MGQEVEMIAIFRGKEKLNFIKSTYNVPLT